MKTFSITLVMLFSAVLLSAQQREFFPYLVEAGYGLYLPSNYRSAASFTSKLAEMGEAEGDETAIAYVKISPTQKSEIIVSYTNGPSDDPAFYFYKVLSGNSLQYLFHINCDNLYIPGNGNLYASGMSNNYFDVHRKYRFTGDNIKEIRQPFYYVGMTSKTHQAIKLYADKDCKYPIAGLPKGYTIIIIGAEFADIPLKFLIRTPFGLVGWWKANSEMELQNIGLHFYGD